MTSNKMENKKKAREAYKKPKLNYFGTITNVTGSQPGSGPDAMMRLTMGPVMD